MIPAESLLFTLLLFATSSSHMTQGLSTSSTDILDENGQKLILRGASEHLPKNYILHTGYTF